MTFFACVAQSTKGTSHGGAAYSHTRLLDVSIRYFLGRTVGRCIQKSLHLAQLRIRDAEEGAGARALWRERAGSLPAANEAINRRDPYSQPPGELAPGLLPCQVRVEYPLPQVHRKWCAHVLNLWALERSPLLVTNGLGPPRKLSPAPAAIHVREHRRRT